MSIDRLATRSGGVIGTIGPIRGSGVFSLQERYALTADNYEDVSLYLKMNGANGSTAFYDSSLYGHTVTANGNAQISTAQSKFGGASARLNGGSDRLSNASAAVLDFGTGDFTVEMWIRLDNTNNQMLLEGPSNDGFQLYVQSGDLLAGVAGVETTNTYTIPGGFTGTWRHVAVSRNGTTQKMFVDGVEVSSGTTSHDHTVTGFQISRTSAYLLYGYIDDLRVTKGVARYTSTFIPPQREFLP